LGRGNIWTVTIKNFKGYRKTLSGGYQANTDLGTIRAIVTAVTPLGLGIAFGRPLKVGGGDVIEQKIKAAAEQFTITLLKVKA
jgi:hypothetical protein